MLVLNTFPSLPLYLGGVWLVDERLVFVLGLAFIRSYAPIGLQ